LDRQHEVAMNRDPVDTVIGRQIRALRLARAMSQSDLGALIGATAADIELFETGARRVGTRRIVRIAKALRVDVGAFFGGWGMFEPTDAPDVLPWSRRGTPRFPSRAIH